MCYGLWVGVHIDRIRSACNTSTLSTRSQTHITQSRHIQHTVTAHTAHGHSPLLYSERMLTGACDPMLGMSHGDIMTSSGTLIEAPVVVNAAGPHSSKITELAYAGSGHENDMRVVTRPLRQEVAYVDTRVTDTEKLQVSELVRV